MFIVPAFIWYAGRPERFFWKEYLPGLWILPFMLFLGYFYYLPAGPCRRMLHFEANNVPLPANEGIFKA